MFNLLVAFNNTAWETDQLMRMEIDRFHEASGIEAENVLSEKPNILKALEKIPTLLMYEAGTEGPNCDIVRYGYLSDIKNVHEELIFRFKEEGRFSRNLVKEFGDRLGIGRGEYNRTHWAIKDGGIPTDMLDKMQRKTLKTNSPVTCFIIMPFRAELEPVRDVVKETVERQSNGIAFRADDTFHPGNVIDQVKESIAKADFCVVDVTGANPNVLWEAGYAHALNKPVIQIGQDTSNLPFDIRALRTLQYSLPELSEAIRAKRETFFHGALTKAVHAVVLRLKSQPRLLGEPYHELQTLANALQTQSIYTRRHEPVLGLIFKALKKDEETRPNQPWKSGDADRFMQSVAKVSSGQAQNVFWWLIVHGVFAYDQIEQFQVEASAGWKENLDLVHISERGVALLNQLKNPI